jgi:hypothetical protein
MPARQPPQRASKARRTTTMAQIKPWEGPDQAQGAAAPGRLLRARPTPPPPLLDVSVRRDTASPRPPARPSAPPRRANHQLPPLPRVEGLPERALLALCLRRRGAATPAGAGAGSGQGRRIWVAFS